jgi:hypothetical protein
MDATVHAFIARFEAGKQAAQSQGSPAEPMFARYFDTRK